MSRDASGGDLVVDPVWVSIGATRVSARVARAPDDRWDVAVILSRPDQAPPLKGQDIEAALIDQQGRAMAVVKRPAGPLFEVAQELRILSEGAFQFQGTGSAPAALRVTYEEQTARFQLVKRDSGAS